MQVSIRSGATALALEVETYGESSRGTVLLIMGLGTQLIAWPMEFCQGLVGAGYRVIRFDNRDVGLSSKFAAGGVPNARSAILHRLLHLPIDAPYTLDDMALDAVGLLDALDLARAHVVGASLGGMIGQLLAVRHAARVQTLACIMSSAGAPMPWESTPAVRKLLMEPPPAAADIETLIRLRVQTYKIIGGPGQSAPDELLYELAKRSVQRSVDTDGTRRQFAAAHATGSLKGLLRDIRVPTLLIHGSDDPLIPARRSQQMHRAIRGSKLMILEQMGHNFPRPLLARMVDAIVLNCLQRP